MKTPKILLLSTWTTLPDGTQITAANSSDQVGRNIESFRDGAQRSTRAAYRIEIGNDGWSWPKGSPQSIVDAVNSGQFGKALRSAFRIPARGKSAWHLKWSR